MTQRTDMKLVDALLCIAGSVFVLVAILIGAK